MSWIKRIFGGGGDADAIEGGPFSPEDAPAATSVVPTDVAALLIFNPDDLQHAADWPIAWYAEPGVWQHESAAGRLIAWNTRSDGGYRVRMRHGPLTAREHRYAVNHWTFPFEVQHGRVFMDNSDCLPGRDQMDDAEKHEKCWLSLPNGSYLVTVYGIDWEAEPGARDMGNKNLPNYVVSFVERGDAPAPAIARRPPDISGNPANTPTDAPEFVYSPPPDTPPNLDKMDFTQVMPAGIAARIALRGLDFSSDAESPLEAVLPPAQDGAPRASAREAMGRSFVMVPEVRVGALAVLARIVGSRGRPGVPKTYTLMTVATVRITEVLGAYQEGEVVPPETVDLGGYAHPLYAVRVEPVFTPLGATDDIDFEAFRTLILDSLRSGFLNNRNPETALYHAHRVGAMTHVEQLIGFLTTYAGIGAERLLEIDQLNAVDQVTQLRLHL